MDKYLLEDASGYYLLEDGSGDYLLEDGGSIPSIIRHHAAVVWSVITRRGR